MNDTSLTLAKHRIIVTVDAQSHLPSAIELAVAMAVARNNSLHGLFVEDMDLISVARLPFTQEVTLQAGIPRALDDQQLRRSMASVASRFQQLLMQQAERSALACSYGTVRGRKQSLQLGDAEHSDLFIVGQPQRERVPALHSLRFLLLANRNTQMPAVLEPLIVGNQDQPIELLLLSDPGHKTAHPVPAIDELLRKYPNVIPIHLGRDQLPQILLSPQLRTDAVIIDRQADAELVGQVLRLATCPVIVVS
jgi:hypothetical protein